MKIILMKDLGGETIARAIANQTGCDCHVTPLTGAFPKSLDQETTCIIWPSSKQWLSKGLVGDISKQDLEYTVNYLHNLTKKIAQKCKNVIFVSFSFEPERPGLGLLSYNSFGDRYACDYVNLKLAELFEEDTKINLVDSHRWYRRNCWPNNSRLRRYYVSKSEYSREETKIISNDISGYIQAKQGKSKRVIALDLDNTLWGGILGDCGRENLKLGGHDIIGEAFAHFQEELLHLKKRGFLLVLVSKNDEAIAIDAIDNHPEMILKLADFTAFKINWNDKASNLRQISEQIGLPLHHFVFIDDNRFERGLVRELLPEVHVPDWPEDPSEYVEALWNIKSLSQSALTEEDRNRHKMYGEEAQRNEFRTSNSYDDWLESIELILTVDLVQQDQIGRVTQLFAKTNQFNLAGSRLNDSQVRKYALDNHVFTFNLKDRFGNYGLVGVIGTKYDIDLQATVVEHFLLSCRAFDRGVQDAMIGIIAKSTSCLDVQYKQNSRNKKSINWLKDKAVHVNLNKETSRKSKIDENKLSYNHININISNSARIALEGLRQNECYDKTG